MLIVYKWENSECWWSFFFIWQSYGIKVGYGGIPGPSGGRDASASQGGGCCSWKSSFSKMTHIPLFVHLCLHRIWCCFTCVERVTCLLMVPISNSWKISTIITWILVNIGCVYTCIFSNCVNFDSLWWSFSFPENGQEIHMVVFTWNSYCWSSDLSYRNLLPLWYNGLFETRPLVWALSFLML